MTGQGGHSKLKSENTNIEGMKDKNGNLMKKSNTIIMEAVVA
jgi:hypothetical protein